jgi:L-ascorbate metabolism protein UlaG (beta-lactamase superfamily)
MTLTITWLGHSTFSLDIDGHKVLFDPFLTDNPLAAASADELEAELILVSHAHGDHIADVVSIAGRTGATVVSNFEMSNWFSANGVENVVAGNPGGSFQNDLLSAKWTIAHHSSSFPDGSYGGQPNGFVVSIKGGPRLYYAGDTALFMDMQLIGEEKIDVAFLPIGDVYTMGPGDSLKAIKYLSPRYVVPMHYNTWPPIVQNVTEWADEVNRETNAQPIVLDPGGSYTI